MARLATVLVAALLLLGVATRADDDEGSSRPADDSDVIVLTDYNFDELTATGSWLIEFYAPWCGHCKKLKPVFEEAARILDGKINLGAVDCTQQPGLAKRFDIKSYPSLKFLRDGEVRPYRGDRSKEALVRFGLEVSKPPVEEVRHADVTKRLSPSSVSFLFFEGENDDSEMASKVFERVAFQLQGTHRFMRADPLDLKLAKKFKIKSAPRMFALSEGGDDEPFKGPWVESALKSYISAHGLPLVSELDGSNFEDIVNAGRLIVFSVTDPGSPVTSNYIRQLTTVAKKRREIVFANIDGLRHTKYVEQFGVTKDKIPTLFSLNYTAEIYYISDDGSRVANEIQMLNFINGIYTGRVTPRETTRWWSPTRYYRKFEKWLSSFSESELMMVVTGAMVVFTAFIFAACYYAAKDLTDSAAPEGEAAADGDSSKAKPSDEKKVSKPESKKRR